MIAMRPGEVHLNMEKSSSAVDESMVTGVDESMVTGVDESMVTGNYF